MQETLVQFLAQEDQLEKGEATHSSILGLSYSSAGKESSCNVRDLDLIPGLGRSPGKRNGNPLQYSGLENSMDRGAWQATYSPWGRKESDTTERLSVPFRLNQARLLYLCFP